MDLARMDRAIEHPGEEPSPGERTLVHSMDECELIWQRELRILSETGLNNGTL